MRQQKRTAADSACRTGGARAGPTSPPESLDSPPHGPPPARFSDGEVLVIQYRGDPAAIAEIVPAPLSPAGDTVMLTRNSARRAEW